MRILFWALFLGLLAWGIVAGGCNSNKTKQIEELQATQKQTLETTQEVKDSVAQVLDVSTSIQSTLQAAITSNNTIQIEQPGILPQIVGLGVFLALFYLAAQYIKAKRRKKNGE